MKNPFKNVINNQENMQEIKEEPDFQMSESVDESSKEVDDKAETVDNIESTDTLNTENDANTTTITNDESNDDAEVNPLQDKLDLLNSQYIRLAADFDNFRKRTEQEREALLKYGAENTLKKMLEVIDNFERGQKAIETMEECEKVKECFNLAYKNFTDVLKKVGLEQIKAEGEMFDPNLHEAIMQTPTSDKPENTILAELQKGYKLGDKVLRPTLVNVATQE